MSGWYFAGKDFGQGFWQGKAMWRQRGICTLDVDPVCLTCSLLSQRAMNIIQKAQNEVQSQLSNDQKMKISKRAQEKMEEVNEQILAPQVPTLKPPQASGWALMLSRQEEAWLSNLNEEQRKVWCVDQLLELHFECGCRDDTRKVADNAEPQVRMQLIRRGQLKVQIHSATCESLRANTWWHRSEKCSLRNNKQQWLLAWKRSGASKSHSAGFECG